MKKLFILSGGPGREREVSISSGNNVADILSTAGIPFESIIVENDKTWNCQGKMFSEDEGLTFLKEKGALVFQVIHGTYGEDGELASKLEENGIAHVGSSAAAMRTTIDKYKTEQLLSSKNIGTTKSFLVERVEDILKCNVVFPVIVKPKDEGSSVALTKISTQDELERNLKETVPVYGAMLVQEFVSGREFTCGVVDMEGQTVALLPTEIILTKGELFDYEAKYTPGGSQEITPAPVDEETKRKIQELAILVHTTCGCKDISRTDIILDKNRNFIVLEINTVPGMTKTSFIPAQLQASGFSLADFIGGMLNKYS